MEHNNSSPELNELITTSPPVIDDKDDFKNDSMTNPYMFQGDILLTEKQMNKILEQLQNELNNETNTEVIHTRTKR
uniref:Uncharacterized protein n=1 Tax=Rhabditophanes sp. KR3021 TaxID=114890 RepID=A0AC35U1N3_9BILA